MKLRQILSAGLIIVLSLSLIACSQSKSNTPSKKEDKQTGTSKVEVKPEKALLGEWEVVVASKDQTQYSSGYVLGDNFVFEFKEDKTVSVSDGVNKEDTLDDIKWDLTGETLTLTTSDGDKRTGSFDGKVITLYDLVGVGDKYSLVKKGAEEETILACFSESAKKIYGKWEASQGSKRGDVALADAELKDAFILEYTLQGTTKIKYFGQDLGELPTSVSDKKISILQTDSYYILGELTDDNTLTVDVVDADTYTSDTFICKKVK